MFNLVVDPIIGVLDIKGKRERLSLPQLYFKLGVDRIATFPALRPHQRHAWHALLCQLGALACLKFGSGRYLNVAILVDPGDISLVQDTVLIPALETNYPLHGNPL